MWMQEYFTAVSHGIHFSVWAAASCCRSSSAKIDDPLSSGKTRKKNGQTVSIRKEGMHPRSSASYAYYYYYRASYTRTETCVDVPYEGPSRPHPHSFSSSAVLLFGTAPTPSLALVGAAMAMAKARGREKRNERGGVQPSVHDHWERPVGMSKGWASLPVSPPLLLRPLSFGWRGAAPDTTARSRPTPP